MTEHEKANFEKVGYEPFKKYLRRYAGNGLPKAGDLPRRTRDNCKKMAKALHLLREANGHLTLTKKGEELVKAYTLNSKEREIAILRETLKENDHFRLHWAWICDNRERFTTTELIPVFRKIGYSNVKDESLKVYIRSYIDWARSAQLCTRSGIQGQTHKILIRMKIGEMEGISSETVEPIIIRDDESPERIAHFSLYKLNAYICDFLADETHEGDLKLIMSELEKLRKSDIFDDLIIDLLEGQITTALETRSAIAFAILAQALRNIRERYIG